PGFLGQAQAEADQRCSQQEGAWQVNALFQAGSGWYEPPDEEEEKRYNGQVEVEDGLPAPGLHDNRAVERAQHSASLGYHADETKGKASTFFAVEIASHGHGQRHHGPSTCRLDKARHHQPGQARGINIDANVLQEAEIDSAAQEGGESTEKRTQGKD